MKTLTLMFALAALSVTAAPVAAMNGQADRINEARTYPHKAVGTAEVVKVSSVNTLQ